MLASLSVFDLLPPSMKDFIREAINIMNVDEITSISNSNRIIIELPLNRGESLSCSMIHDEFLYRKTTVIPPVDTRARPPNAEQSILYSKTLGHMMTNTPTSYAASGFGSGI